MNNDQVIDRLTKLAIGANDESFAKTISDIAQAITTSLNTGNDSALNFFRKNYPYIGSLSKESMKQSKESILDCAWQGINNAMCVELHLNDTQLDSLFSCFTEAKDLGKYKVESDIGEVIFHEFESDLLRFSLRKKSSNSTTLVWRSIKNSLTHEEEVVYLTNEYKKLNYSFESVN